MFWGIKCTFLNIQFVALKNVSFCNNTILVLLYVGTYLVKPNTRCIYVLFHNMFIYEIYLQNIILKKC